VISPEGCAAILWRDAAKASEAAESLKPTSDDLLDLGIIDKIIPEPPTGAHNDPETTAASVKAQILAALDELAALSTEALLSQRLAKYRVMGEFEE
jgi:acetyl-CoA carboxylase carboxyl transferase subunit alpha